VADDKSQRLTVGELRVEEYSVCVPSLFCVYTYIHTYIYILFGSLLK
jgi:hypothetical protein